MELNSNQYNDIKIKLFEKRKIELIDDSFFQNEGKRAILIGRDGKQDYTIVVNIIDFVNGGDLFEQKMERIKQNLKGIKECSHQNVLKLIDELLIDNFQIIIFEKCEISIYNFIKTNLQNKLDDSYYQSLALQMLEGLKYLHSRNIFLKNPSLKNILLDKDNLIKYINFELNPVFNQQNEDSYHYLQYHEIDKIQYIPPENIEIRDESQFPVQKLNMSIQGDIWSVCMCLYELAGAQSHQSYRFSLGLIPYQNQFHLHYKINIILSQALQRNPSKRPSVESLINEFSCIDKCKNSDELIHTNEELSLFQQVQTIFENEQYEEALALLLKLIAMQPDSDKYLAWVGRAYFACDKLDESEYWSNSALRINKSNDIAYFNLGNVSKTRKQSQLAIEYYNKSINCNPKNVLSMENMGLLYDELQMYEKSLEIYLNSKEIEPDKPYSYFYIGRSYFFQKKYEDAAKYFHETLQVDPKFQKAYYYLGEISKSLIKNDEAVQYFKKSLEINPLCQNTLFSLGAVYYLKYEYNISLMYYKKAYKLKSSNKCYYMVASNMYVLKKYDKAVEFYKKALNLQSDDNVSITYITHSKKYM